jgi:hypothetical protein
MTVGSKPWTVMVIIVTFGIELEGGISLITTPLEGVILDKTSKVELLGP